MDWCGVRELVNPESFRVGCWVERSRSRLVCTDSGWYEALGVVGVVGGDGDGDGVLVVVPCFRRVGVSGHFVCLFALVYSASVPVDAFRYIDRALGAPVDLEHLISCLSTVFSEDTGRSR